MNFIKKAIRKIISTIYHSIYPPPQPEAMEETIQKYRKWGIRIGEKCMIYSNLGNGRDAFLLSIGDNVTVSGNVKFLMHDNGICKPTDNQYTDILGKVSIGNNCFIGYGSIILPGVEIADNCIIGAGAVVTKSIDTPGVVYGGNPATFICTTEDYFIHNKSCCVNLDGMTKEQIKEMIDKNPGLLKKR